MTGIRLGASPSGSRQSGKRGRRRACDRRADEPRSGRSRPRHQVGRHRDHTFGATDSIGRVNESSPDRIIEIGPIEQPLTWSASWLPSYDRIASRFRRLGVRDSARCPGYYDTIGRSTLAAIAAASGRALLVGAISVGPRGASAPARAARQPDRLRDRVRPRPA